MKTTTNSNTDVVKDKKGNAEAIKPPKQAGYKEPGERKEQRMPDKKFEKKEEQEADAASPQKGKKETV